jgi:hypothetical protein
MDASTMANYAPARRITTDTTTTWVQYSAVPSGAGRENGPHLGDLRVFVASCEGVPDDVRVDFTNGHMGESGRYNVSISLVYKHP